MVVHEWSSLQSPQQQKQNNLSVQAQSMFFVNKKQKCELIVHQEKKTIQTNFMSSFRIARHPFILVCDIVSNKKKIKEFTNHITQCCFFIHFSLCSIIILVHPCTLPTKQTHKVQIKAHYFNKHNQIKTKKTSQ